MKKCKSCQTEIDSKATKCPHCLTDQRGWFRRHPILSGILGIVIFFVVIGAIGSNSSKNNPPISNSINNSINNNTPLPETSQKQKVWSKVIEISGNANKNSDSFELLGGKTKITYTFNGGDVIVGAIYILKEGTDLNKSGGIPEVTVTNSGTDATFVTRSAGTYYLSVKAANTSWIVKIEEEK